MTTDSALVSDLLIAIRDVLQVGQASPHVTLDGLDRVIDVVNRALANTTASFPSEPSCPAVVSEQISACADLTGTPEDKALHTALAAVTSQLAWSSSYLDYTEPDMLALHQGYFFTEIAGRRAPDRSLVATDEIGLFLTIQTPELMYPSHVHKAPELYHVVAGTALWERGTLGFNPESPGAWINHPTGTRHAMLTETQPLLAMAVWTEDTDSIPVIVRH